ncbi:MAG: hypothetical protein R2780_07365 [Crocinitomicaceae bacterium]|nr:hypothetical protein [Crocinitomicaceae bacterium]
MRFYILTILIGSILVSCGNEETKGNSILDTGTVKHSGDLDTCACNELDIDSLGMHLKNSSKYTGICYENYPETDIKYIEKNILNGQLHGKITYFDKAGEIILEEIYEGGNKKRSGEVEFITCHCSELAKIETPGNVSPVRYFLDEIPFTGSCEEYYPESKQVYMEVTYENGFVNGFTTYFNKDGSVLLIEKYENGELVKTIH